MKSLKTSLSLISIIIIISLASCTKKETTVSYGFICSENLLEFIEPIATYSSNVEDQIITPLSHNNMESLDEKDVTNDDMMSSFPRLLWQQHKKYDDKASGKIEIKFRKIEGIDYSEFKGKTIEILKYGFLNSYSTEKDLLSSGMNQNVNLTLNVPKPDIVKGDNLESYINNLTENPIVVNF